MPIVTNSHPARKRDIQGEMLSSMGQNQSFSILDAWQGFKDENILWMGGSKLVDLALNRNQFPPEEGYNVWQDPRLAEFGNDLSFFSNSQSRAETDFIATKIRNSQAADYNSPWYWLGRTAGFVTDPTSLMLFAKATRGAVSSAKVFGTLTTAEEIAKQNLDPARPDEFVPWTIGLGYGVPAIMNGFRTGKMPQSVKNNVKKMDEIFFQPKNLSKAGFEEGKLIDPNKVVPPSSGGAAANPLAPKQLSYNQSKEAEQIFKTYLKKFGEDGPWTPIFRTLQSSSLRAREMITELLDIPLLQNKNMKQGDFKATAPGGSIETNRRILEKDVIVAQKEIENLYLKYLHRLGINAPRTKVGMNFINRLTPGKYSLREFAKEISKARINHGKHDIPEIAEAARVTQDLVYEPFLKMMNAAGVRLEPIEREMFFWESILHSMKRKNQTMREFTSELYGTSTWNIKQIENRLIKLKERLEAVKQNSGVKNYVNRIYIRPVIEKNKELFKEILRNSFIRNKQHGMLTRLNQIVEDLANDFPFVRYERAMTDADRFAFNNPRYARATRAREVWLDDIAQLELMGKNTQGIEFIVTDMFYLMKSYYRQVAPDILLAQKYGDANGLGWRTTAGQAGYADGLKQIEFEYAKRIEAVSRKREAPIISKETKIAAKDVDPSDVYWMKNWEGNPQTGKAYKVVAYRGITKTPFKGPIDLSGKRGRYWAHSVEQASAYSDNVIKAELNLINPLVIKSDKDFLNLVKKATGDTAVEGVDDAAKADLIVLRNLRRSNEKIPEFLKKEGHDALIIDLKAGSKVSQIDQNQIVVFEGFAKKPSNTLASKLKAERNKVLMDIQDAIELIRGTYGVPKDPTRWWSRGMRMSKHWNALSMLTGFFSALPDPVRIIMTNGIKRTFNKEIEMYAQGLKGRIFHLGKKEGNATAEALDMTTGHRAMLFSDIGDMFALGSKIETNIGRASMFNFMYVNMMSRWTEYWKSVGSTIIGGRILEDSIAWSKNAKGLKDKWKSALANSGIDEAMAARIAKQFEKHGEKLKYNLIANTDAWDDLVAVKHYRAALNKEINRTIVTPGLGDTPLWMSTELGSTIAQFKKFVMAATQRMLMRGMQERDMDFMFGALMLMGSGMMIDGLYTEFRFGKDWGKKSLTDKLLSAFDRSGLGGIYVDVNRAIESLSDNRIGIRPMLGEQKPYSNSIKSKLGNILGPSAGQIANIFDIMYDVGSGGYNHYTARKVRRLIPFQNLFYLDWLFDDIEQGLR